MNYLLFAADANDVVAVAFLVFSILFEIALVLYLVLTRVGKKEVDRLIEGKCPFSGEYLSCETKRDERKIRKTYGSYNPELVFRKAEDGTVRARIENTCSYEANEIIDGDVEETFGNYDFGYSVSFIHSISKKNRKNPDSATETIECTVEKYTYTVSDYGKLGALKRIRLKKACRKASFTTRSLS